MFHIAVVVLRVTVELDLSDLLHRELAYKDVGYDISLFIKILTPRPDLGHVEGVESHLDRFLWRHDLVQSVRVGRLRLLTCINMVHLRVSPLAMTSYKALLE